MPILVTEGAQMKCSLGSAPKSIKVTSRNFNKINNSLIAQADKAGVVNIPSFGSCSRSWFRPACTPKSHRRNRTT